MNVRHTTVATCFILGMIGLMIAPAVHGQKVVLKGGDLETGLTLLDQFGGQNEACRELYSAAYKVLSAKPDASYADLAESEEIQKLCSEGRITHLGGPMLGRVRADRISVWLRTLRPAKVEVVVNVDGTEQTFGPVASTAESYLSVVVPVTGLKPATSYPYKVLVDRKPVTMPQGATMTTAPEDKETGKVRIVFGSCFHRWGLGNMNQAELILKHKPAALLLYGDIAVQDRENHLGLHRSDYLLRDLRPAWQKLAASMPVYATWDDHDYFNNDKWGIPRGYTDADRKNVRKVFTQAWNNPFYGFEDKHEGVFTRTRIGPCDVIMVDNRYFRTGEQGSFLGNDQMKWLEEQLLDCRGPFIIMSCGTMWSDYVSGGKDSWGRWDPEGRERIFSLIEKHRIPGVLLVSGDRHGARGFTITRPSGFKIYEFEPGSLGARTGPPSIIKNQQANQLFGISGKYAFGEFAIDATLEDPEVTFSLVNVEDGRNIYETTLKRSQLTPPK